MNPLKKIGNYTWEISKDYKECMNVPGIIYSSDKLIGHILSEQVVEQVSNVACLPGIVKASLAMPDVHWGYGFPIGGVAAFDPEEGGVVSPGGVGYDINCLCGKSLILHELGFHLPIEKFESLWQKERIKVLDLEKKKNESSKILIFLKRRPKNRVYKVITKSGRNIIATEDHPFYTRYGMRELRNLSVGSDVAIYPFEGLPYEKPSDEVIVDEEEIIQFLLKLGKGSHGNALRQIISHLRRRKLIPLRQNSPQLPYLLKIMGYVFGDGNIYFTNGEGKGITWFYGKKEDLEDIRKDIKRIGYTPSRVYLRKRENKIKTLYSEYRFENIQAGFKVSSSSFASLLCVLGCPLGNKRNNYYHLPSWIFALPRWQKRLFLASYFGAEMSTPSTLTKHDYNLYAPVLSLNKSKETLLSGKNFLEEICSLLNEIGVKVNKISQRKEQVNADGTTSYRLRLILSSSLDNLINFYSRVGFEYNAKKKFLGNVVLHFLRSKQLIIEERNKLALQAKELKSLNEWGAKRIYEEISSPLVNLRFIERSIYEGRKTSSRIGNEVISFSGFKKIATEGLGESGMVWEEIISKEEIKFDDFVYDFTVAHKSHNFIANNFVVSNCGVRLIRSNLTMNDLKPHHEKLMDTLFNNVPCGVGIGGKIKLSRKDEREVFLKGARWAVEKGFGIEDDLKSTEENGKLKGANPDLISERAYERGKKQIGTLGSGNHFLEVQVVDEIYDKEIANSLGIFKGEITIMIHTGSRGFGHQVCDDNLRVMQKAVNKYGIKLPDRQLACAPINSKEGKNYFSQMTCAANYAWCNRQIIMHLVRESFQKVFGKSWEDLGLYLVYDVTHNIAKFEEYEINGKKKTLCVHRKGATRAFPKNHPKIPEKYKDIGQPVIIPGDMGRASYLLIGTEKALSETWGSTCHGAGREMSRHKAIREAKGRSISKEMREKGIIVRARKENTLAEEMSEAYKDVNDVVEVVDKAGISHKISKMRPLGVVKG